CRIFRVPFPRQLEVFSEQTGPWKFGSLPSCESRKSGKSCLSGRAGHLSKAGHFCSYRAAHVLPVAGSGVTGGPRGLLRDRCHVRRSRIATDSSHISLFETQRVHAAVVFVVPRRTSFSSPYRVPMRRILLTAVMLCPWLASALSAQVDARMFRYPDVSASQITFVYAGDIWLVPRQGGVATRLSSPRGEESFPRFSPDGSHIAYSAEYDGNTDIYVIPTVGGEPFRVTHHPLQDRLVDWYPDGKTLLMASSMASGSQRFNQLYRVPATGGMPEKLPVPYGEFGAISPDGTTLAYMPETNDFRTWKRYRGGWAPDIWLFDLKTLASENITHDPGNDAQPMWHGRTLYFLSDRDSVERNNIWAYDLDSKKFREVTHFTDFDVTFPAIGPDAIVFQAGGRLYLLDLATEKTT